MCKINGVKLTEMREKSWYVTECTCKETWSC